MPSFIFYLFIYNSLSNESTQKKNYLQVPTFTLVTHLFQARWRSLSWSISSFFFFFSQPRILFRISQAYIIAGIQAQVPLHLGVILSLTGQKLKMSYKLKYFFLNLALLIFHPNWLTRTKINFLKGVCDKIFIHIW